MKKKILSLALALALSAGLAAPALAVYETPTFTDVKKSDWCYTYVEQAAEKKWIAGNPDGSFSPNSNVTYAQFCVMLVQAFYPEKLAGYTGPSSPWYVPACTVAGQNGFLTGTNVERTPTQGEAVGQSVSRYEMAQMLYNAMKASGTALPGEAERQAAANATADWNAVPDRYRTAAASVRAAGVLSGVDSIGTFSGGSSLSRAQAAVVLCKLDEIVRAGGSTAPTQPEAPADPQPSGNYGPVGTMSDTPVTLSLETHKPIHDYWSQQSTEIRSLTDKDNFNAAVQTMKDVEMILTEGEIINSGVYRNRGINPYYNYATADLTADKADIVATAARMHRGYAYGNYAYMMGARNNIYIITKATDSDQLAEIFTPIFARFPANATDRQKVDICMQEIVDRFDYETGVAGAIFDWTNGKTKGNCESYAYATSQILAAAGIPNMVITATIDGVGHALVQAYIDGQWMDVDGTLSESSGVGAKGVETFEEYERHASVQHVSNNTDETKVARALVEASLS